MVKKGIFVCWVVNCQSVLFDVICIMFHGKKSQSHFTLLVTQAWNKIGSGYKETFKVLITFALGLIMDVQGFLI